MSVRASAAQQLQALCDLAEQDAEGQRYSALAAAPELGLLFKLSLARSLRGGPRAPLPPPAVLLRAAQRAAEHGNLSINDLAALRRDLRRLAQEAKQAGLWCAQQSLWWEPLPSPAQQEEDWRLLRDPDQDAGPPPAAELGQALLSDGWSHLPRLLTAEAVDRLWRSLEHAWDEGRLSLEREGTGAEGRLSAVRSDRVMYLDGHEPEWLQNAPTVAALVQLLRGPLTDHLGRALPGQPLFAPQRTMLARYPAPSAGYHPHLDNPGNEADNRRTLTLVLYLNPEHSACQGGEIQLWAPSSSTEAEPNARFPARGGDAVLFDARTVPHQVLPLRAGPARWALTLWLSDQPRSLPSAGKSPRLEATDALLAVEKPSLPPNTLLLHRMDGDTATGQLQAQPWWGESETRHRAAIVSTVYGEQARLETWCEYHFSLGFAHLVLIFDRLQQTAERALARRLRERWSAEQLSLWDGEAMSARWQAVADQPELAPLLALAEHGASSYAVSARQALNASAALRAAREGELGGAVVDWLLHLDADELFLLEGDQRGGSSLAKHLSALDAAGLDQVRYLNHEILPLQESESPLPHATQPGTTPLDATPCFKLNPRLAVTHLGPKGWESLSEHLRMQQSADRPYFTGYFNGKSAVRVKAACAAAGMHGWLLQGDSKDEQAKPEASRTGLLAGPSVLHFHLSQASRFSHKYLAIANSPTPPECALFPLSPVEERTVKMLQQMQERGSGPHEQQAALDQAYARTMAWSKQDIELLDQAGLLLRPTLSPGVTQGMLGLTDPGGKTTS